MKVNSIRDLCFLLGGDCCDSSPLALKAVAKPLAIQTTFSSNTGVHKFCRHQGASSEFYTFHAKAPQISIATAFWRQGCAHRYSDQSVGQMVWIVPPSSCHFLSHIQFAIQERF